jgi:hypothetical protein
MSKKEKIVRDLADIHQLLDSVLDEDIEITSKKLKALTPEFQTKKEVKKAQKKKQNEK